MAKYKIEYDREGCIGAGVCVSLCPENWSMSDDGKATVAKIVIDESELKKNKDAAEGCPVNVIHIVDEKGNKII